MKNLSITHADFSKKDYAKIDDRIKEAMKGWKVEAIHKNKTVTIPGTWNAVIYPYKYFEVYKQAGDDNPGEDENEIQCYLSCGWKGTDDEVVIVLTILGYAVLNGAQEVGAEIYKFGSDKIKVYKDNKLITNFTEKKWFGLSERDINKTLIKNVL